MANLSDEEYALATLTLTSQQWNALRAMEKTVTDFEPLENLPGVGPLLASQLEELGLVEAGALRDRYKEIGLSHGYKVTNLGWRIVERGRFPRRLRPAE